VVRIRTLLFLGRSGEDLRAGYGTMTSLRPWVGSAASSATARLIARIGKYRWTRS
jgi:hypothetical protein